ncbi:hypothetical protein KAFR_0B05580 [Kazachstania africana CBS 2517]|uniref:RWD domain-containing protein n=1 Tax=Kazachstania africana (strain ATCC 22294 / BCRC 22015 / CBS 2517 / CECT 1963 / NBRC 1671 / NRRL Y-8276) TaxID=1071382 RepID=H2AR53_KAZAF|nr:hypothetical protein KAFR_0B05580 [Kazachstania africana CBS 2517]CCF56853.1 hypothetical protein KAFR_0B05580 [Kazachstania africana CBS 2517]
MSSNVGGTEEVSSTFGKSLSLKVDGGFNAVSINPSGRDVVLASRQGLYIIDLDDPFSPPRWLYHATSWQVADVQWSPHPAKPYWVVSTSNQKAIIWNLTKTSSNAIEYVLHGHSRAITDINFSPQHPDILATCSIDTYVHAWDMRSPQRPFYSTSSWKSSAAQVKWNHSDVNIMASSHGDDVFIWDLRNGSTPLFKLSSHESSVNSIDFNRFRSTEIMSSSNDGTVKFWDYSRNVEDSLRTIHTDFPIWRGRYLPFGEGFCVMPTVGGNNSVYMMDLSLEKSEMTACKLQPAYTFKGHTDRVIDFLWRCKHTNSSDIDDREFQLVTWSKDSNLKLWPITENLYEKVHYERNMYLEEKLPSYEYVTYNKEPDKSLNLQNATYQRMRETFVTKAGLKKENDISHINWLSGIRMNDQDSPEDIFEEPKLQNLAEEVSSIGHKFPKIVFEKISLSTGELVLTLNGPWSEENPDDYVFLRVEVVVPSKYPNINHIPVFNIEENSKLSSPQRLSIVQGLKEISKKYTDASMYCLEACLRFLLGEKVDLDEIENDEPLLNFDLVDNIDFDETSSLPDSESSRVLLDSSSDSDDEDYKHEKTARNTFGRNLAFDSTPVPNESGAVWTATGQLLYFSNSESVIEKKHIGTLKLGPKNPSKGAKATINDPCNIYDEGYSIRPKRYVETFSNDEVSSDDGDMTSDDTSSEDSFGSFTDDWNDIVGNDVVVRTRLPEFYGTFAKQFTSVPSDSVKTGDSSRFTKNRIIICDFSQLMPDRKELAVEYQLMDFAPENMCRNNALVAENYGFEELSHCWQILSDLLINQTGNEPHTLAWGKHPMTIQWFFKEAISYYEKRHNLQMLAMLYCIFIATRPKTRLHSPKLSEDDKVESVISFNDHNNFQQSQAELQSHYSTTGQYGADGYEASYRSKVLYSSDAISVKSENSLSNSTVGPNRQPRKRSPFLHHRSSTAAMNTGFASPSIPDIVVELVHDEILDQIQHAAGKFLDDEDDVKLRKYVYQYAKLLFRWQLPLERVKILKVSSQPLYAYYQDQEATGETENGHVTIDSFGEDNKSHTHRSCNYCNLKVKGTAFICGSCQHILHSSCAKEWWTTGGECPAGCGCICPEMYDLE